MEPNETSLVIEAGSEIVSEIERQEARAETSAWLKELSSFATAMIVTSAGAVLAGVVALLFCYAFFIAAPIALIAIVVATARSMRRERAWSA